MIFVIPIILGAAAIVTGSVGVIFGAAGLDDINTANKIGKDAQEKHENARNKLEETWKKTQKRAEDYGQLQLDVRIHTIKRFIAFIERIGQRGSQDKEILEGLEGISPEQIQAYKIDVIEAEEWAKGSISAAVAGATAASGVATLARTIGTTTVTTTVTRFLGLWSTQVVTEVGISQLGGAAARNAIIAWAGGGSMAVGGLVFGGITVGPALMVSGFKLAGKGEKALTQAREYEAKVNTDIATINEAQDSLLQVQKRITELSDLVEAINKKAIISLDNLESKTFNPKSDAAKFQQVALLIKALAEILKTPILDAEGKLNPYTENIREKYRTLGDL